MIWINLYDEDAFELVRDLHTAAATVTHLGDNGRDVEVLVLANYVGFFNLSLVMAVVQAPN